MLKEQKNNKVLLIVPAYNEEKNILKVIEAIKTTPYDYIVINDGSKDYTEKLLIENIINHISLINNIGIGGAVQTGIKYAKEHNYDIAVQFDGDNQHDIKYVKKIIKPICQAKASLVIGSRFLNKDKNNFNSTFSRRIGIKTISNIIFLKTGVVIKDVTSGFRAMDKQLIEEFSKYYPYEYPEPISNAEVILKGYKIKEISVKMKMRESGKSSIFSWKNIYYMVNVILNIIVLKRSK